LVEGTGQGLTKSLAERRERWAAMFEHLSRHDIAAWRRNFLDKLDNP
jgi:trehalose 6-phosphate synthase